MGDTERIKAEAIRKAIASANGRGTAPHTNTPPPANEPWPDPLPLGYRRTLPAFPTNIFPGWLEEWTEAVSEAMQTPTDLAAMLAFAVTGAALAKKVRVEVRPGWQEPANLYTVTALAPGERKSPVFTLATGPVQRFEAEQREAMRETIAQELSRHRILEARLKGLETRAAKAEGAEAAQLEQEAQQASRELAEHVVPPQPQGYVDDVTPEKLANLLAKHGGRMLVAAAEGTAFEIAKGRYSESANFDIWLKGHAGDPLKIHRISREPDEVEQPALSAALAVQPDVICGLAEQAPMRGRGFLARWLYAVPQSIVGHRTPRPSPVPEHVAAAYQEYMIRLWRLQPARDESGAYIPIVVPFTPEADDALLDLERWLEPHMGEHGELSGLAGWANKLAGVVARLALILHVADRESVGTWQEPIRQGTVEAVVRLARDYLIPHAQTAFGMMGADARLVDARRVVRWLTTHFVNSVNCVRGGAPLSTTRRDIHAGVWGGQRKAEELDEVLNLLVRMEYLRADEVEDRSGRRGRKPSTRYLINPNIFVEGEPAH